MNWFWDNICLKKEERTGMLAFICLLICLLLIKWYMLVWYQPGNQDYNTEWLASIEYTMVEPNQKVTEYSRKTTSKIKTRNSKKINYDVPRMSNLPKEVKRTLFLFDPNTISFDSLILLGFSKYAAGNIEKYRAKGGYFDTPNDLQKIYGLEKSLFDEIKPYVQIHITKISSPPIEVIKKPIKVVKAKLTPLSIDISLADTTEFKRLKGIGSVYANRIVKFRNSLGGYFSIDQLKQVWGISDSLFVSIKPYLTLDSVLIQKQNINQLDRKQLAKHPYMDWKKAKIITNYRKVHGEFESIDDFRKMHGISEAFVDTLSQYFVTK